MSQKVVTKLGDIFFVKTARKQKKYFQLIAFDLTQLNSDVIRAFEESYPIDANPDFDELVRGDVAFYAHCVTKWGVKLGFWEKAGNSTNVGKTDHILFRGTSDYGHKAGEEPVTVSKSWYVWHIGDRDFTHVGKLEGESRKAEIGVVMDPLSIVNRMKTGEYGGFYPGFE